MDELKKIEFEDLPSHLLEYIFYYIPMPEIVRLSQVSPIFLITGNNVVRRRFFELHSRIYKEMKLSREELCLLPKTEEFTQERIAIFRSYYFLEMMLSEMNLIRAVWRNIVNKNDCNTVPIGKLLHEFYLAFYIAKRRALPPWHINDETECKIIKYTKLFLDCKLKYVQLDLFGCQILDILDSMINKQFTINVKYHPENNQCSIEAVYKLRNPHYLSRPPKLNANDENSTSAEDKKEILSYFVNLVRINNRVTLREEQYHRESEASRSSEMNLLALEDVFISVGRSWLNEDVREYMSVHSNPQREERKINNIHEFEETYRSTEFSHSTNIEKKFICNIRIKCPLNEAPLNIMNCWSRLKSDLLSQLYNKPHLIFLEDSLDKISGVSNGQMKVNTSGEHAKLHCTVEVCITSSNNNFEICRLVITDLLLTKPSALANSDKERLNFNELPDLAMKRILQYLPFSEVEAISSVSRSWFLIGNKYIRDCFFDLGTGITEELIRLKIELTTLPRTFAYLRERIALLRSYFFLEMLLSEMSLIKAFWKNVLYNVEGDACSIGPVLDQLYYIYKACKRRNIPFLRVHNALENHMITSTTEFFARKIDDIVVDRYYGCQIIDLVDSMISRSYVTEIKYKCRKDMISSTGYYQLPYLSIPPESRDIENSPIAQRKALLMLTLNWVRDRNRATLRVEHFHKEWELQTLLDNPDVQIDNIDGLSIMSDVRQYPITLTEVDHGLDRENVLISFKSEGFRLGRGFEGIECNYRIYCPLNRAPILTQEAWGRTKQKIKDNTFLADRNEGNELRGFINYLDSRNSSSEDHPLNNHDPDDGYFLTMRSTASLVNGYREVAFLNF